MKFLSVLILNLALIATVHAAQQQTNETKPAAEAAKTANAMQSKTADAQQAAPQKHDVLKTQFVSKRPYSEKSAK